MIGSRAVGAASHKTNNAGLDIGVVISSSTDPTGSQILTIITIAKSTNSTKPADQEVILGHIALSAVE